MVIAVPAKQSISNNSRTGIFKELFTCSNSIRNETNDLQGSCRGFHFSVNLLYESLQNISRTYFREGTGSVFNHRLDNLRPFYGACKLLNQIVLDFLRIGMCFGVDILIDRTQRRMKGGSIDGCLKFDAGRLHQRGMKCAAYIKL